MKFVATIASLCGACLIAACAPKLPDVSGTWVARQNSPMGEMEFVLRLKEDTQGNLTGSINIPFGDAPIQSGRIDQDNNIQLTVETESFGNLQKRDVTAKLVGDELHLDFSKLMPGGPPGMGGPGGPGGPDPGVGGPPAGGPPGAAGAPGSPMAGMPPFKWDALVAKRGEPKPSYKAPSVDYKTLPKVELPALKELPSNNLAKTPPMGWNSYNKFHLDISDAIVRGVADAMVASGMRDAGYLYIIIDDGWQDKRDANGVLQPNPHFPDMKALADYVHSKGLKLGIYSSPGPRTCGGFEGSYGYEALDIKTWAEWGIDYLKYDWCSASRIWTDAADMRAAYQKVGEALQKTGREIVYNVGQYGWFEVESWGRLVGGNLWRTTSDISDNWNSMLGIVNSQEPRADKAGPGGWNDPDMLEVGNGGMSPAEYRTHFSLWAMVAAPLIAGNDLRSMDEATQAILLNKEVIAVNQDPLGKQGRRVAKQGDVSVWLRPLQDNAYALALVNEGTADAEAKVDWSDLKLPKNLKARDLWEKKDLGALAGGYTTRIPSHGVAMLRLQKQ